MKKENIMNNENFLKKLNLEFEPLSPEERVNKLYNHFKNKEILLTSSFAVTSAYLLYLFSNKKPKQEVIFIDTGYHFKETLVYKDYLTNIYDLKVKTVKPKKYKHVFTSFDKTWKKDPDFCCSVNKLEPIDKIKNKYKVWVSGLMSWQSNHRNSLNIFEERGNILKFYPLLDVSKNEREALITKYHLPFHPLQIKGYFSVGCEQCSEPGKGRDGRWNNKIKTECGLHL